MISKYDKINKKNIINKLILYDTIIIGAGISGLYYAYELLKKDSNIKILIIEKGSKKNIGGRMGNIDFYGTKVVTGAGIGRKNKDLLLQKLLNELNIPFNEFISKHTYTNELVNKCNVKKIFIHLKNEYKKIKKIDENSLSKITFKKFAIKILGTKQYNDFIICSGYSDYENADIHDVLYYYGFSDNYNEYIGLSINWTELKNKLVEKINIDLIKTNIDANNIYKINDNFIIKCLNNNINKIKYYLTKKIVIATTINTVKKLLPTYKIYKDINSNIFLRLYGKFSKDSINIMKKYIPYYTILNNKLQKIIPINPNNGIYMISYSDNKNAKYLHKIINKYKDNKNKLNTIFENLIKEGLNINENIKLISIKEIYWKIGTHYYKPLNNIYKNRKDFIKKAQNPCKNISVIGEMISLNQGWIEGALSSVKCVL
jgi:hypothetical protein